MRELNECKAEILRRSESEIKKRKQRRKTILSWCIPLCLVLSLWSVFFLPAMLPAGSDMAGNDEEFPDTNYSVGFDSSDGVAESGDFGTHDSFSFSLTWGCYGISCYNSETGKLVKTTDATNPDDYVTEYLLTDKQKLDIYNLISSLDITTYPDSYNPNENISSSPTMTLILSVKTDKTQKNITAENIALSFESQDAKGQKFLDTCNKIIDILTQTDEWKSLPEYEFFYD